MLLRRLSGYLAICLGAALLLGGSARGARAEAPPPPEVVKIWPGIPPGTEDWTGAETDMPLTLPGQPLLHMVTNVTVPTLTVFRPAPGKANGTAVIVCPGGGFQYLAVTHEGEMVAQWLADRGITAFVLKYRVRRSAAFRLPSDIRHHPENFDAFARLLEPGRQLALADGIQAMRFLRANAAHYGIAPDRIGFMGFSAGAMTTMGVILDGTPADRPNFAAPIYGAMEDKAAPTDGPPLFIAASQDDPAVPVTKSIAIFSNWTAADLPAELHVYDRGGHGFGMLKHGLPEDAWSVAFEAWLKSHGWLPSVSPSH
jgi:acetyl esterase/lipase